MKSADHLKYRDPYSKSRRLLELFGKIKNFSICYLAETVQCLDERWTYEMQIFSERYGPELFNADLFVSEKLTLDNGNAKHGHLHVGLSAKDEVKRAQRVKTKKSGQGGPWTSSVHDIHLRALFIALSVFAQCPLFTGNKLQN